MYEFRFGEKSPERRSIEQLRGIEGARVRKMYELLAQRYGLKWDKRQYDPNNWDGSDLLNKCVSAATACLYGITEAAVLAAGYAPAIGFIHTGKPQPRAAKSEGKVRGHKRPVQHDATLDYPQLG